MTRISRLKLYGKVICRRIFGGSGISVDFPMKIVEIEGKKYIHFMSVGPDDALHPGLPPIQAERWKEARSAGVRFLRGLAWMGLPGPPEACVPEDFVFETALARSEREQRQISVNVEIWKRGVGKQAFDDAGGWASSRGDERAERKLVKACAEWADGELVAAHVAYENEILCTNDRGRQAGKSIFNAENRQWLAERYGVRFLTVEELAREVGP